jgi:Nucleotidyl transferase AbiEii toxin, Type IV TA system
MAESFLTLSAADKAEALLVAASKSGRPAHILEKDVWVVWTLDTLFKAQFGEHLVFKGGTSLSKVYKAIDRFSEDIDVTYDIRTIADDLVTESGSILPPTMSQARKWSDQIKGRLDDWQNDVVLPLLRDALTSERLDATVRLVSDPEEEKGIYIDYTPRADGYGYIPPRIKIEFGARDTGEPADLKPITCDASEHLPGVDFPTALPKVMLVERTAWEKMTAIHVFCNQQKFRKSSARHWYDVAKLDVQGHVDSAIERPDIAKQVSDYKSKFFQAKDHDQKPIDYSAATTGHLVLVPTGSILAEVTSDYDKMVQDRLFLGDPGPFERTLERCRSIAARVNQRLRKPE